MAASTALCSGAPILPPGETRQRPVDFHGIVCPSEQRWMAGQRPYPPLLDMLHSRAVFAVLQHNPRENIKYKDKNFTLSVRDLQCGPPGWAWGARGGALVVAGKSWTSFVVQITARQRDKRPAGPLARRNRPRHVHYLLVTPRAAAHHRARPGIWHLPAAAVCVLNGPVTRVSFACRTVDQWPG